MKNRLPALLVLVALGAAGLASAKKPTKRLSDEARGELLYDRHCAQCHGPTAAGNGPATVALVADVPDLRGRVTRDRRDELVDVVLLGRGAMPGYTMSFDRYDARRVLRHMERVGPADAPAEPAPEAEAEPPGDAHSSDPE